MQSPEHLDEGTVHAWLDGQLPATEAAALESHLHACESCSAMVAEARGLMAGATRILGALDDVPAVRTVVSHRRQRQWVMPSAAAATLLIAAVSLLSVRSDRTKGAFTASTPGSATEMLALDTSVSAGATSVASASSPSIARPTIGRGFDVHGAAGARPPVNADAPARGAEAATPAPVPAAAPGVSSERVADGPQRRTLDTSITQDAAVVTGMSAKGAPPAAAPVSPPVAQRRESSSRRMDGARSGSATGNAVTGAMITGRVTTEAGAPIAGVVISVPGATLAASTDNDGRFTLAVPTARRPADSVAIMLRRVGYTPVTRTVRLPEQGLVTFDASLEAQQLTLDAVVATGVVDARRRLEVVAASGCYAATRPPSGVPTRFVLDSAPLRGETLRPVRNADGRVVGRWSSPASGQVQLDIAGRDGAWSGTFNVPRGDESETVTLGAAAGEVSKALAPAETRVEAPSRAVVTMTVRRVRC